MTRKPITDMSAWPSLSLEGNLITPAMIAKIDQRAAPGQKPEDYSVRKGLTIREEISTAFRVGQSHFDTFAKLEEPTQDTAKQFISGFFKEAFGYDDLMPAATPIAFIASERVPLVVVPPAETLDRRSPTLSIDRSHSPAFSLQDYLNDKDEALWGIVTNGTHLRLMRDNASLTRPAYIEADLAQIFSNEDIASFAVLWLLIHRSRFGAKDSPATDCALERWRDAGSREGEVARDRLAGQVQIALKVLGSGFLEANPDLATKLKSGEVNLTEWFNELLRLVYRLIFLMVAEDRNLLHPTNSKTDARVLYAQGYSLATLRKQCYRAATWDKHHDRYEGIKIVFRALAHGQDALALPALGGLFADDRLPHLETARLRNKAFMEALYRLSWLADKTGMVPVNWRAMATEELGSVYETLLELQPQLGDDGKTLIFASEATEQKGNQRKTTGSYYTPDSLVQALLDTALDPVLDKTEPDKLLKLAVIDPACGSGHFLLAAARRIATRLARYRAEGTPALSDFRHALRDVARSCLYGVDRNPMAVELTKVALWIETVDPGLPLGFFDAQIRCGDALLGVFDLKVLEDGVPDDAYKPLTGDNKPVARHYLQKNRREKAERDQIAEGFGFSRAHDLMRDFAELRAMPEETIEQIEAKTDRLRSLACEGADGWTLARACDFYVAAFLLPKRAGGQLAGPDDLPRRGAETVPTSGAIWEYLRGVQPFGPLKVGATEAAGKARAFHWPLEFPDIMQRGGFDVVLGNPPWERVKLQEQEFFALKDQEIATAKNAAARKKLIAALSETNPRLSQEWQDALRTAATESHFIRGSDRFPLGGVGDVNTYAAFTDLAWRALHPSGRAGLIIPNGLVVGFTYREFLRQLLSGKSLVSFYGFENEEKIFKDVHNETKFGLLTISGKDVNIDQPWFTAHIRQPSEIVDPEKRYALTIDEIRAINPNTLNLPAFRWSKDAKVAAAIHTAAPILIEKEGNKVLRNDWGLRFKTMFHMASDSSHFIDHEAVEPLIKERRATLAILQDDRQIYPLYEGKMFWHFDHRYGSYQNQTQKQANKGVLPRVTDEQHSSAEYRIQPRYWVDAGLTEETLGEDTKSEWFFSWRDVGPTERTFVGTIIPKLAMGHASPYLVSEASAEDVLALCSILSSLVIDYAVRQKSSRMTFFIVEQLPMLTKERLREEPDWLGEEIVSWINRRAIELFYTNWELKGLADSLGLQTPPFKWDPVRRSALQAEIDAAAMHLYELTKSQAEWVLDSFTVLRKYEERDHEEFRTKRLVLAAYDAMARAKQLGIAYETTLSPPPADPSLCHDAGEFQAVPTPPPIQLSPLEQIPTGVWAWAQNVDERDRVRMQLRAMVGILPEASDARRVRLATLACLRPALLDDFLSAEDRQEWRRVVAHQSGLTQIVPPTNAAWGTVFNELISSAVLDVSSDGDEWSAGQTLDRSTLSVDDPAVGRALFAWSRLQALDLEQGLTRVSPDILPFIQEGYLAA